MDTLSILFKEQKYSDIPNRLQLYFQYKPANYEFYCFLQKLSYRDRKKAVLDPHVQNKIENALKDPQLPTFILMLDLYFIVIALVNFGIAVTKYINYLWSDATTAAPNLSTSLWLVISCGIYFFIRELMQISSLVFIGYFSTWLKSTTNYVDIICIVIMLVWPSLMLSDIVNRESKASIKEVFQSLSALAAGFLFLLVFSFLRRISLEFAVVVRSLFYIFTRLYNLLLVLVIIITAFALMFYAMIIGNDDCGSYCDFVSSFFGVYDMILGSFGKPEGAFQSPVSIYLL